MALDRRSLLRKLGAGAGVATLATAGCAGLGSQSGGGTYQNPVFGPSFPDPTIVRVPDEGSDLDPKRAVRPHDPADYDGTYYAYATEQRWFTEAPGDVNHPVVPIVKSEDLVDWEFVGEAFEYKPNWKGGGIWAPDIAYHDGRFLLYYSLSIWGDPNPGIGVATADDPTGYFEDQGEVFRSEEIGVPNSIDPMFVRHEGTPYLVWGSFNGIRGVELTPDGLDYVGGTKFSLAGGNFEAAYIIERDGYYYFFGSEGSCCSGPGSTYRVSVGRAESFAGPYLNRAGDDLRYTGGTTILEGRNTLPGDDERFVGPGHNSIVRDDAGNDWILYHSYDSQAEGGYQVAGGPGRRMLMIDRIEWEDGWPTVNDGTPSVEADAPVIGDGGGLF